MVLDREATQGGARSGEFCGLGVSYRRGCGGYDLSNIDVADVNQVHHVSVNDHSTARST